MTQRDRLAALLHDVMYHVGPIDTGCLTAASLLATRGVRVVDVESLATALRVIPVPATYEEWLADEARTYKQDAAAILAALDAEDER